MRRNAVTKPILSPAPVRDDWVLPILRELVPEAAYDAFTASVSGGYWREAVRAELVTDEQVLDAVARRTRIAVATGLATTPQAREHVPERVARRYGVLPLEVSDGTIDVATGNPYDIDCERTLEFVSGRRVRLRLAAPARIAARLDEVYRPEAAVTRMLAGVRAAYEVRTVAEPVVTDVDVDGAGGTSGGRLARPVVQLVDHVVAEGIACGASDIHLEPEEAGIAVRYRVDGVLRQTIVLPAEVGAPLVSRIKIMAGMDIADRLRPQGGRACVTVDGARIDLRVSTLPASHGEKVVIRILDSRGTVRSIDSLGLDARSLGRLRRLLDAREGLVLVTGPTGSGKTTTLYAALAQLLQRGLNIITVEDPVEYRVPGIVQVQVNEKAGLTFAAALRSILRQDPDVVLIGEIRDRETAAIAVQAALTGHLVFATLHTIDACSSVTRLHDLGIEPAKVAAALKGIVAQRLVRRLCPACAAPSAEPVPPVLWDVVPSGAGVLGAVGCEACGGAGYKGRLAVTELLLVTPELERQIAAAVPAGVLVEAARRSGTRALWDDGVEQLLAGRTSVEEIVRVLEPDGRGHEHGPEPEGDSDADAERGGDVYDTSDVPFPSRRPAVTGLEVGVVDVYVIDPSRDEWRVLALRRGRGTRCTGAWEAVHGRIEPGETPEQAALREVREETGLDVRRLYNVTVHGFYLHAVSTVQLAVVFCAFVDSTRTAVLGAEHDAYEWLTVDDARERFLWPRASQALLEIRKLLRGGDAGPAEDVLRVV